MSGSTATDTPLDAAGLREALATSDAVLCTVSDRLDAEVLGRGAAPGAGCSPTSASGSSTSTWTRRAPRGIAVTNTPGVLTEDTADLAVALMLMAMPPARGGGAGASRRALGRLAPDASPRAAALGQDARHRGDGANRTGGGAAGGARLRDAAPLREPDGAAGRRGGGARRGARGARPGVRRVGRGVAARAVERGDAAPGGRAATAS